MSRQGRLDTTHKHTWIEVKRTVHREVVMGREVNFYMRVTYRCACGSTKTADEAWPA